MKQHALVTGATGFIGANVVRHLLTSGFEVSALVRETSDRWRLRDVEDRVQWLTADLADARTLEALPPETTSGIVIHAGADGVKPGAAVQNVIEANIGGTLNLLSVLSRRGTCSRFVFLSSCSVYGQGAKLREDSPLIGSGVYAQTKIAGEAICRAFNADASVPCVILRVYTPYGPFEAAYRFVAGTLLRSAQGGDIALTGGEQSRDFIHIDDVAAAVAAAATRPGIEGQAINVGTGISTTIRDAVQTILRTAGGPARPQFGALPYRADETWEMSGDPSRMRELLGIDALKPFGTGIEQTWQWLSANMQLYERKDT